MALHDPAQSIPLRVPQAQTRGRGRGRVLCRAAQDASGSTGPSRLRGLPHGLGDAPLEQREALLLVGAHGMSYEEAAAVCQVAVGTVKSRVNRARSKLASVLDLTGEDELGPDDVTKAALAAR